MCQTVVGVEEPQHFFKDNNQEKREGEMQLSEQEMLHEAEVAKSKAGVVRGQTRSKENRLSNFGAICL